MTHHLNSWNCAESRLVVQITKFCQKLRKKIIFVIFTTFFRDNALEILKVDSSNSVKISFYGYRNRDVGKLTNPLNSWNYAVSRLVQITKFCQKLNRKNISGI